MSANERSTGKQAKAGIPYDFYRRKAHQARSDFLAESFVALRRSCVSAHFRTDLLWAATQGRPSNHSKP